jgi:hypothetical protein
LWITSCTYDMPRSACRSALETYHGASTIILRILDWLLWIIGNLRYISDRSGKDKTYAHDIFFLEQKEYPVRNTINSHFALHTCITARNVAIHSYTVTKTFHIHVYKINYILYYWRTWRKQRYNEGPNARNSVIFFFNWKTIIFLKKWHNPQLTQQLNIIQFLVRNCWTMRRDFLHRADITIWFTMINHMISYDQQKPLTNDYKRCNILVGTEVSGGIDTVSDLGYRYYLRYCFMRTETCLRLFIPNTWHMLAWIVEAPCQNQEGRGFQSRRGH